MQEDDKLEQAMKLMIYCIVPLTIALIINGIHPGHTFDILVGIGVWTIAFRLAML